MNYQEQQQMRERMRELRKQMEALLAEVRLLSERVETLESSKTLRLPRKNAGSEVR